VETNHRLASVREIQFAQNVFELVFVKAFCTSAVFLKYTTQAEP
jgi:hypothetical protein